MVPFKVDNSKPYFYSNTSQQQTKSNKNSNINNLDLNRKFSGNSQNSNGSKNSSNELNNQNTKNYNNTYNNAYNNYYSGNGNGNYYKTNNNENNNYDYYPKGNKNKNYNKASKKSEDNINIHKKSLFNNMDSPSSESKGNGTYYSSIAQEKGENLFLNNAQSNNECEDCKSRSTSNTVTTIEEKNEIFSESTSDLNTKQTSRQVFMTHYEGSCNYSIFKTAITPCFSESALQNIVSFIVMKN